MSAAKQPISVEEQYKAMMEAVGVCLIEWAAVEWNICILYCECVVPRKGKFHNAGPHTLIFDSVVSIETRMNMVKAIIGWRESTPGHGFLAQDCGAKWKKLKAKIAAHYKKRNEVAHASIIQSVNKDAVWVALAPFATMSSITPTAKRLTLAELQERGKFFRELAMEISAFRNRICNHEK